MKSHPDNQALHAKYAITAWWYDILDYPWERLYKQWRPQLLQGLQGKVLEAGCGTGRNFTYYPENVELTAIELSKAMLIKAAKRATQANCHIELLQQDATNMHDIADEQFDWIVSTFMCCVMPDHLQPKTLDEFSRILKPGGRFKLLEMIYSKDSKLKRRQDFFAPLVEKIYGARFDRHTLEYLSAHPKLEVSKVSFLKDDTYLLVEGYKT